jgi:hypothetical protein
VVNLALRLAGAECRNHVHGEARSKRGAYFTCNARLAHWVRAVHNHAKTFALKVAWCN